MKGKYVKLAYAASIAINCTKLTEYMQGGFRLRENCNIAGGAADGSVCLSVCLSVCVMKFITAADEGGISGTQLALIPMMIKVQASLEELDPCCQVHSAAISVTAGSRR